MTKRIALGLLNGAVVGILGGILASRKIREVAHRSAASQFDPLTGKPWHRVNFLACLEGETTLAGHKTLADTPAPFGRPPT